MTKLISHDSLTREQIEERLALAEDVCRMFAWTATDDSPRGKAGYMLWQRWLAVAGHGEVEPKNWPHLSDEAIDALAAERDAIRAGVLRKLVAVE